MKFGTNHTSYYVNVSQLVGIVGGLMLGWKALRIEEAKAGIEHRTVQEIIVDDVRRVKDWYSDTFGVTKQYRHY